MNKLTSLIRRAPKRLAMVVAMVAAAIIVPAAAFAWGPDRPTYTKDNPADHITFNSMTGTDYGDERNFVTIKDTANTGSGNWKDEISVENGKTYTVRMFVHNNAASSLNLVAENVTAKFNLPTQTAKRIQIDGYLSATNSEPLTVFDQAVFSSEKNFNMSYVAGSAKYINNKFPAGAALSDTVVSSGAKLGYDKLDGKIPGCFQYTGYVVFEVKATTTDTDVQKTVRINGATDKTFKESVTANAGQKVDYQVYFKNTGGTPLKNVVIKDALPKGVTYVPGTTYLNTAGGGVRLVADGITANGINIGDYAAGADAYIKFTATVAAEKDLACGTNTLKNVVSATSTAGVKEDSANVVVSKTCAPVKITVCELATKKIVSINEADFNASKYSKNLKDCETPTTIVVCEIATKKIVSIKEADFNATKYSKDLTKCDTPKTIEVCEIATKKTVTINESAFDASKYTKDLSKCETTVTPPELPKTGPTETILGVLGIGAIVASLSYYIASRKALGSVVNR